MTTIAQYIIGRLATRGPCGIDAIAEEMGRKLESVRRDMGRLNDAGLVVADIRDPGEGHQFKRWKITPKGRACDRTDPLGTMRKISSSIAQHREIAYRKRINDEEQAREKKRKAIHAEGPAKITEETQYKIAAIIRHDPRYQIGPDEAVPSIYRSIPLGATLEAA